MTSTERSTVLPAADDVVESHRDPLTAVRARRLGRDVHDSLEHE
ncbi:hypothetical protein ENSA5_39570 [Enhygromyxa salina]|uniref:Uncharacterized protein n=1 Tax=Enhygromyxa salina TaxID=215803 RepID=A0A2S9XR83_9BACT|nr:hypothetical protein [Enhygromyxa salina]PRP95372.1 hypothetical protein ENSA5_39570 [Enhygromyxa salina]